MRKVLLSVLIYLGLSFSLACTSLVTEAGIETMNDGYGMSPYVLARCNLLIEPLSHSIVNEEGEDFHVFLVWLVPEAHLTPVVQRMSLRVQTLIDVPWPGQFGVDGRVNAVGDYRLAVFYRQSW